VDPLITILDAQTRIHAACQVLGSEQIALDQAIGRVLAEPFVADRPLPPYRRAMMDGVAFSSSDVRVCIPLKIAGLHAAGDPPPRALQAGEAWEIMTGAAVPDDCDTIVPYEDLAEPFTLSETPRAGQFIHDRGYDAKSGDILVPAGTGIGPAEIAIAASIGKSRFEVFRRPKIAIITTGDEAVGVDSQPETWQIRRSNGPMLEAALARIGCAPCFIAHVADDPTSASQIIRRAHSECDVLILCGGISMGKKDHVRALIERESGAPEFHGVMLRPGKPFAFWNGPPQVFALPGNPVSVLATFTRFVVPALMRIQGMASISPLKIPVANVTPLPEFTWLLPVAIDGNGRLIPRPPRNSGDYPSIAGTIGMIEVPPETDITSSTEFSFHPYR